MATIAAWLSHFELGIKILESLKKIHCFIFRKKNRDNTEIMFIDNELAKFKLPEILKRSGYRIHKMNDVNSIDDRNLEKIDIFFIDINGVGKSLKCTDGIGLARLLKGKFNKSIFCVYSAKFNPSLGQTDGLYSMKKQPDSGPFLEKIEEFIDLLNK